MLEPEPPIRTFTDIVPGERFRRIAARTLREFAFPSRAYTNVPTDQLHANILDALDRNDRTGSLGLLLFEGIIARLPIVERALAVEYFAQRYPQHRYLMIAGAASMPEPTSLDAQELLVSIISGAQANLDRGLFTLDMEEVPAEVVQMAKESLSGKLDIILSEPELTEDFRGIVRIGFSAQRGEKSAAELRQRTIDSFIVEGMQSNPGKREKFIPIPVGMDQSTINEILFGLAQKDIIVEVRHTGYGPNDRSFVTSNTSKPEKQSHNATTEILGERSGAPVSSLAAKKVDMTSAPQDPIERLVSVEVTGVVEGELTRAIRNGTVFDYVFAHHNLDEEGTNRVVSRLLALAENTGDQKAVLYLTQLLSNLENIRGGVKLFDALSKNLPYY